MILTSPAPADTYFEEAERIAKMLRESGQTQEQLSRALGVSQSYIANKLRLLRFTTEERELLLASELTERHARALLRIPDDPPGERNRIIGILAERRMNVSQAEEYIEEMLRAKARSDDMRSRPPEMRAKLAGRNIREFCTAIDRAVDGIRKAGIAVESSRTETEESTVIRIRLPKAI